MNQKTSRLFKFFSLSAVTLTVTAIAIFSLLLASCAPIAENERMVVPYGYAKISVAVAGHQSGRAVTQGDKDAARLEIFFNGKSNGESTHGVFPVDSTVSIRVVGYRQVTGEVIGVGTTTHKMNRSNNVAHVTLGPVSGSYILRFSYGEAANLPGLKAGLPSGTEFYKGGEQGETPSGARWTHGTLSGWSYNDESGSPQTASVGGIFTMPNTATTLTAQWNATPYTINYESGGGSGTATGQFTAKQSTVQLDSGSNFSNGGNVLTKWQANGTDFGSPNESVPVQKLLDLLAGTQSVTLTAKWEALQTFAVTFDEGSQTSAQSMPSSPDTYRGGIISLAQKPTVTGYDFKGWKVTKTDSGENITTLSENETQYTMPGDYAITLTAQWQLKTYSVTYSWGNGVSISTAVPTQNNVTHGSTFTVNIPNVTRTGYNFLGWSESDGQTSNPKYASGGQTTSDVVTDAVTLYAVWEQKTYSVTYSWGSGVSDSDVTGAALPTQSNVMHGDTFTVNIPNVTRTGYDFLGWDTAPNKTSNPKYSSGGQTTSDAVTSAVTLYAVWGQKTYSVTYSWGSNVSGVTGDLPTQGNVTHGSTFNVNIPNVTRTGYNFLGWSESDGQTSNPKYASGGQTTSDAVIGAVTLYAVWEQKTYSVTYSWGSGVSDSDVAGATLPTQNNVTHGSTFTVNIPNVTRTGYNFLGWSESDGQTSNPTYKTGTTTSAAVTGAVTLYAVWEQKTYSVTYSWGNGVSDSDVTGATLPTQNNVTHGSTFTVNIPSVTRRGYDFLGWSETDGQTSNPKYKTGSTTSDAVTGAVTLYAVWELKTYTIIYNPNNGSGTATGGMTSFNINTGNITFHTTGLTRQGYTFVGWSNQQDGMAISNVDANTLIVYAAGYTDITLYAVWEKMSTLYVSSTTGDDYNNDGSSATPLQTLVQAFDIINAYPDGTNVTINISEASTLERRLALNTNKTVTINGNGTAVITCGSNITIEITNAAAKLILENITLDGNDSAFLDVQYGAALEIRDGTVIKKGWQQSGMVMSTQNGGGNIIMSGGSIQHGGSGVNSHGITLYCGTFTMTGGEITGCATGIYFGFDDGLDGNLAKVTLNGTAKITGNSKGLETGVWGDDNKAKTMLDCDDIDTIITGNTDQQYSIWEGVIYNGTPVQAGGITK